jgi:hypothetical protein
MIDLIDDNSSKGLYIHACMHTYMHTYIWHHYSSPRPTGQPNRPSHGALPVRTRSARTTRSRAAHRASPARIDPARPHARQQLSCELPLARAAAPIEPTPVRTITL